MSFSSYDPYTRYRKRSYHRIKSFVLMGIFGVGIFAFGFWVGGLGSSQRITLLSQQLHVAELQQQQLENALTETQAEAQTALSRYEQLQNSVSEIIPEGPMQDLVGLVRKQLDNGIEPERLAFVIRSSRPPQNCTEAETRRFVITTPAYTGAESKVDINGLVSVKGSGISAYNAAGQPEAWYDPTRKVDIEFVLPGGVVEKKSGVLPLQKSVVVRDREYRFTISEGPKSFAKVTFDSCDYP